MLNLVLKVVHVCVDRPSVLNAVMNSLFSKGREKFGFAERRLNI
jgi:hypothetical protein